MIKLVIWRICECFLLASLILDEDYFCYLLGQVAADIVWPSKCF